MIIIAIVKLLAVLCILFSAVNGKGRIPDSDEIDVTMSKFNKERREMAKALNISNMNRLSWDYELAKAAAELTCVTQDNYTGPGRVMAIDKTLTLTKIEGFAQAVFTGTLWSLDRYEEAWLHPLQTQIGCAEQKCKIVAKNREFDRDGWCVMGPHKTFSKDDVKEGPAGSGCGSMENDDGLCENVPVVNVTVGSSPDESEKVDNENAKEKGVEGSTVASELSDSSEGLSIPPALIVVLFATFSLL